VATINGIPVNFGFAGVLGISNLSGFLILQGVEESAGADKDEVRTYYGDIIYRNWFDQHYKATLECVITGSGINAAISATILSFVTPGTIIFITCTSMPDLSRLIWEAQAGASIKGGNTNAKRMSIPLEWRQGIFAQA